MTTLDLLAPAALSEAESAKLSRLEAVIETGLVEFKRVGLALLEIRDSRLYRAEFGTFEEYCRERWGMSKTHANRYVEAAGVAVNLTPMGVIQPERERQLRPLAPLEPEQQREAWATAVREAGGAQPTAAIVERAVEIVRGAPAALLSSESNEWYTPADYVDAARDLMGGIDLDPASCEQANRIVRAARFFTAADDGLKQPWRGRVWLNPPYGRSDESNESNQGLWSARLGAEVDSGNVSEAVLLVNAVTDRAWFKPLWRRGICFVDKRIRFYSPDDARKASPTHGNVLVYFGDDLERFRRLFARFGQIVLPADGHSVAA